METLDDAQIETGLADLPGWTGDRNAIGITWKAKDFRAAMAFMQACVEPIEERQHHPQWSNVYNSITVSLCTHDAGDQVTAKDLDLARAMHALAAEHGLKS